MNTLLGKILKDNSNNKNICFYEDNDKSLSYQDLYIFSKALISILQAKGYSPDARIGIVMPGGMLCGATFVSVTSYYVAAPLNPKLGIKESEMRLKALSLDAIITTDGLKNLPLLTTAEEYKIPLIFINEALLWGNKSGKVKCTENKKSNDALLLCTSGTTSIPKEVVISQANIYDSSHNIAVSLRLCEKDRCINPMPLFHVHGLIAGIWAVIVSGGSVVLLREFDAITFLKLYENHKPTWFTAVPSMHQSIDNRINVIGKVPFNKDLRFIRSSSASLGRSLYENIRGKFHVPVIQAYGMTEATHQITSQSLDGKSLVGSVGKSKHTKVAILVSGETITQASNIKGEVILKGKSIIQEYKNNTIANNAAFIEGWFRTGDEGYLTDKKELMLTGRLKEMINRAGENISPYEIEEVILSHPGIDEAVCFSIPDPYWGEVVGAAVVLKKNAKLSNKGIQEYVAFFLSESCIPVQIFYLSELPKSKVGKLQRIGLWSKLKKIQTSKKSLSDSILDTEIERILIEIWSEVLELSNITIESDFFSLGGSSIQAINIAHEAHNRLNLTLSPYDIFTHRTIKRITQFNIESQFIEITKTRKKYMPLSYAQDRLWFIEQYEKGAIAYHSPLVLILAAGIDKSALINTINAIILRHHVLRTVFKTDKNGIDYQYVKKSLPSVQEKRCTKRALKNEIKKDINTPLNLREEGPVKIVIYNDGEKSYLLLNIHHVAIDGWSRSILYNEINQFYQYFHNNIPHTLPELTIQYSDFSNWQRSYLKGDKIKKQIKYWRNKLEGYQALNLKTDYLRPKIIDYHGDTVDFEINHSIAEQLKEVARKLECSLYTVLLVGFYILLSKYVDQNDIVVGSPIAGRHYPQTKDLIGFFVNMLPLREKIDGEKTIEELIFQVQNSLKEAQYYQDVPFEKIVNALNINRDPGQHPLVEATFIVQDFKKIYSDIYKNLSLNNIHEISRFDIECFLNISKISIKGTFFYATRLFKKETIERLSESYLEILRQVSLSCAQKIQDIIPLNKNEYERIIYEWNNTDAKIPKDKTVHQLFEEQVEKTPNKIAVISGNHSLIYDELNKRANQLARYIRKEYYRRYGECLSPDTIIAISFPRSHQLIIGIFAILKAGGAYLPIDPSVPRARINFICNDAKVAFLMTRSSYKMKGKIPNILFDKIELNKFNDKNLTENATYKNLTYLFYTSGSTGKPKGVMIEHRSLISYINNLKKYLIYKEERYDFSTNISFDASITTSLFPLLNGNTIICYENDLSDIEHYIQHLITHQVTLVKWTPSIYQIVCKLVIRSNIQTIIVGGERFNAELLNHLPKRKIRVYDQYGPTETTIGVTFIEKTSSTNVGIGKPNDNCKFYVLDKNMKPVPIGVNGELYIAGMQLARGYLNRPSLNYKCFLPNPFATKEDINNGFTRLYKTGDLVRWLSCGHIEFIGRKDSQVKIRGCRIECHEVEAALLSIKCISTSAVVLTENDLNGIKDKSLIAYYAHDNTYCDNLRIKKALKNWKNIYNNQYVEPISKDSEKSNFKGWTSAITDKPIPLSEMTIWQSETIKRLQGLNPDRILEIGIGSGILMYPLLQYHQKYVGSDISNVLIQHHKNYLKIQYPQHKINLKQGDASQTSSLFPNELFTLIIINSVCQYFPHINYFMNVFKQCLSLLHENGYIFLGDIRDHRFQIDMLKLRYQYMDLDVTNVQLEHLMLFEKELLFTPVYFLKLAKKYNLNVDILQKEGDYCNELILYRYDVIISKKKNRPRFEIKKLEYTDDEALSKNIKTLSKNEALLLTNIRRIHLNNKIDVEVKRFRKIANVYHCQFKPIIFSPKGKEFISCLFVPKSNNVYASDIYNESDLLDNDLFNLPFDSQPTIKEIEIKLRNLLPEYMIPTIYIPLRSLPLNENKKINKQALPKPGESSIKDKYIAPSNQFEITLCKIWQTLLNIENVGIEDDFFLLGGHSILAIQLIHQIYKKLKVHLSISDIFERRTIKKIAHKAITGNRLTIPRAKMNKFPLSFAQERLWFMEQYEQGFDVYHMPLLLSLSDKIEINPLKKAINAIVLRHDVLRTIFKYADNGESYQVISDIPFLIEELICDEKNLLNEINANIEKVFDLENDLPIRATIYKVKHSLYLFINLHHIAADGWSVDIFQNELSQYYNLYHRGVPITLTKLDIQYRDFTVWQRKVFNEEKIVEQLTYWKNRLKDFETLNITTDKKRSHKINYKGDTIFFDLGVKLSSDVRGLAHTLKCTKYTVLLSAFYILLKKYTDQNDIVVGTPVANRHYPQIKDLIGCFVNILPLREELNNNKTIVEFIQQVHEHVIEAQKYQDIPFEKLVSELKIVRDLTRHPVFQVVFSVQDYASIKNDLFEEISLTKIRNTAKYDMQYILTEKEKSITGVIIYRKSLFYKNTIKNLSKHYLEILKQITSGRSKAIKDITLLTNGEYKKIVYKWNYPAPTFSQNKTISQAFEDQVERTPHRTAIVYDNKMLSYAMLNQTSNQLSSYLRKRYFSITNKILSPDTLISICLEKSIDMMIAIIGVLKSGAAYVPIDPNFPAARIETILKDTKSVIVISQTKSISTFQSICNNSNSLHGIDILNIESKEYESESKSKSLNYSGPENLAYVIYTSGSTGVPKGVMIEHNNVLRLFDSTKNIFHFSENDNWMFFHSYVFDFSVWEIWGALLSGGKLVIPTTHEQKNIAYICNLFDKHQITILNQTPQFFYVLIQNIKETHLRNLRTIIFGGAALDINKVSKWQLGVNLSNLNLYNMYGITECTVHVTQKYLERKKRIENCNIGKRLSDLLVYVLDENLNPVPIGVPGELYVAGAGISRGYLNQLTLSKERFINNPFLDAQNLDHNYTRLYKTGDVVRWLPSGDLQYIGRNDSQVKIRGYRIELGEIQSAISNLEGISESLVISQKRTIEGEEQQYLVAYYVRFNHNNAVDKNVYFDEVENKYFEKNISLHLDRILPDYMKPNIFIRVENFPLTINGKVNMELLPNPDFSLNRNAYIKPRNKTEMKLCSILEELLSLKHVSIEDDFFNLGGDSIISLQFTARARHAGLNISVQNIFELRTIARLSNSLNQSSQSKQALKIEDGELEGICPFLPIQKDFFLKVKMGKLRHFNFYNQSFLLRVPRLNDRKIEKCISQLMLYHDVLRMRYKKTKNGYEQFYLKGCACPKIHSINIKNIDSLQDHLTLLQSQFDIEKGPLWTVAYIEGYEDSSARIFFAFHHLIIDTVSWRILLEDFETLYKGLKLPKKSTSYRQWSNAVSQYAINHMSETSFWQTQLRNIRSYESLRKEFTHIEMLYFSETITEKLLRNTHTAYQTEINDLLLTALIYALSDWEEKNDHFLTLEGHGRESIDSSIDVSRTIGWFTTLYPVKLTVLKTLSGTITGVKELLRSIPKKGIGFSSLAFMENSHLDIKKLSPIIFNYLGQFINKSDSLNYWSIVNERAGIVSGSLNETNSLLSFSGGIYQGRLRLKVTSALGKNTTIGIAKSYKSHLLKIIKHCSSRVNCNVKQYTKSDYIGSYEPYTLINNKHSNKVLCLIHPGDAGSEAYFNTLVPHLSKDYQIIIVDNYPLKNRSMTIEKNFKALSTYYASMLPLSLFKNKSVFLAGHSFGALVAYELIDYFSKLKNVTLKNAILIEPAFKTLIDSNHDVSESWYGNHIPKPTDKPLSLFKCLKADKRDDIFQKMVDSKYLGVDSLTNNFELFTLDCVHYDVLKDPFAQEIAKKINSIVLSK